MEKPSRNRYIVRTTCLYLAGATLWIALSDRLLASIGDAAAVAHMGLVKGLAFVTVTACLLAVAPRHVPSGYPIRPLLTRDSRRPLFAVLTLMALAIAVIAALSYRSQAEALAEDTRGDLKAVARLKADGLDAWLAERRADAAAISSDPVTLKVLASWLDHGDGRSREQLLATLRQQGRWPGLRSIRLLDTEGRPILGDEPLPSVQTRAAVRKALATGAIVLDDLQRTSPDGEVELGFAAPLRLEDAGRSRLLGAVLLRIRARDYLFPYLSAWPMESNTGEIVLLRNEGGHSLVLNPLRYDVRAALALTLPLSASHEQDSRSVSPRDGIQAGYDYRHVRVLEATQGVAGTPWTLAAKVDEAEALANMQHLATLTAVLLLAALVAAFSFIAHLWHQQRVRSAQRSLEQARALRSAEGHFRAIFEHAAVGLAEMAADGRWLRVNQRLCSMLGTEEATLLAQGYQASVHADDVDACEALIGRLLRGAADEGRIDLRYLRGDGSVAWASASVSAIRGVEGEPDYLVVAVQDISALKAAEASLRRKVDLQEYLAKIARTLPGTIYSFRRRPDGTTSMPYTAPTLREVCGVDPVRVKDDAWPAFERIHPDDICRVQASIEESAAKMSLWQSLFRLNHPERGEIWIEGRSMPEAEADGGIIWHGFLYDVTERRRQEAGQRLAASVFSGTQEGVVITDPKAQVVAVNPAFCTITGYDESELIGRHMRTLQSGRQDAAFYKAMWDSILNKGYWQGEIWNRRKNGAVYPEWLTISAVHDDRGAVLNYIGSFSDISRLKESEERLRFLAHHDALTRLPNRAAMLDSLRHAVARTQRAGGTGALLFLDLDRFKNVNDSFGHPAGDELLKQVAQRLSASLRQADMLARLGGDEFLVLLEDIGDAADAAKAAQLLIGAVSRPFLLGQGKEACVGCSIGISLFPADSPDPNELIQHADAALYQAKAAGKGTYRFFETELTRIALRRLELEGRIRRGMEQGEFLLHYQPLVGLASGKVKGAEALLRWKDEAGNLVQPGEFIAIAEETGQIVPLGEWALRTACAQMRSWLDSGLELEAVAVNLSPHQFRRPDIVDRVRAALAESGLAAQFLELVKGAPHTRVMLSMPAFNPGFNPEKHVAGAVRLFLYGCARR